MFGGFFVCCFFGSPFWKFQSAVCGKHHIMVGACGGARCMLEFPIPSRTHPTNLSVLHWATYPNGVPSGVILGPDSSRTWSRTEAGCPLLSARIFLQKRGDILFCFHTLTSPCFAFFSPSEASYFLGWPWLNKSCPRWPQATSSLGVLSEISTSNPKQQSLSTQCIVGLSILRFLVYDLYFLPRLVGPHSAIVCRPPFRKKEAVIHKHPHVASMGTRASSRAGCRCYPPWPPLLWASTSHG